MQNELTSAKLPTALQIVGVNEDGHQADYNGANGFCDGRDLPFLEEAPDDGVWDAWGIRYRDVVIIDENNEIVEVYNLTDNDLGNSDNYETLKEKLTKAAGG